MCMRYEPPELSSMEHFDFALTVMFGATNVCSETNVQLYREGKNLHLPKGEGERTTSQTEERR